MQQHDYLGHRYLVALSDQLQALIRENDVLHDLENSAEVIAATPNDIEQEITANAARIRHLTVQIAQISEHLSHAQVSDF